MILRLLPFAILLAPTMSGLQPLQPLPVVRVELRIDDKTFSEMAQIYSTPAKVLYRDSRLAAPADTIARSFKLVHPFVDWTGNPDAGAQGVFIANITEADHAVTAQWTFYPLIGTGHIGGPCIIYSRFDNNRHLQDLSQFGKDVVRATDRCTGTAGLDMDSLSPFHATLRAALKNIAIASSIDAVDETHVYLPLQWSAFYPAPESIFRVDYWSVYQRRPVHGIAFLTGADPDSPGDSARIITVPHVCDVHKVTFAPIVTKSCGCHHSDFANAAVVYRGLLQTLQSLEPGANAAVYVEFYREANRGSTHGLVDTPDAPVTRQKGASR